jgi:NADPH-dependent glutamate synthase beta subunit-like oxidoreductase
MSGSRKEELAVQTTEEVSDEREVYLRGGRKLVVTEQGGESLVEVRSESGMLEVRIRLTEQGPVLQMESARLSLKATEAVEIESQRVEIKGGAVKVHADEDLELDASSDVRVTGKLIYLN